MYNRDAIVFKWFCNENFFPTFALQNESWTWLQAMANEVHILILRTFVLSQNIFAKTNINSSLPALENLLNTKEGLFDYFSIVNT